VWHSFGSPCLSAFHPIYVAAGQAVGDLARGEGAFDPTSPWWRNERIQRRVGAYPNLEPTVRAVWQDFERKAFAEVDAAEERAQRLEPADRPAELRLVGEKLSAELLATMANLDDRTATRVETSESLPAGELAQWSTLNDPVGLPLGEAVPARVS
ncbi:MAG TPA: hypothetical protein VKT80_07405, partial [Chloroflexota bacterium]|nr:hypothetical protein [Chloroflexota bacterium]